MPGGTLRLQQKWSGPPCSPRSEALYQHALVGAHLCILKGCECLCRWWCGEEIATGLGNSFMVGAVGARFPTSGRATSCSKQCDPCDTNRERLESVLGCVVFQAEMSCAQMESRKVACMCRLWHRFCTTALDTSLWDSQRANKMNHRPARRKHDTCGFIRIAPFQHVFCHALPAEIQSVDAYMCLQKPFRLFPL